MKQAEYWKKRAEELEAALHQQTLRKSEEIDEQFDKAYHALDGQIKAWYQRVAVNNQVSLQEARKLLTNKERKEFQWDIEEYIKHGKENGLTGQWMRELENASAKQHISRLEQIKIQTQQEAEKLYGNYVDEIDQHMRDTYREDYYRTAYNFQMGAGVCYDLAGIDEKALERVIRKPWAADGKNFTDRCWEGKDNLVHTLHTTLTQMCITGEGIASASGKFRKAVDVGKYQADRLIRTESAYFQTAAQKDCYSELGVSEVEIMATLDETTCDICGALDGTHLPLAEAEEGVSTPPFHCNCRCTTVPYYGDTLGMDGRAMRDADGGYDTAPSDLKFEDWKERYVGKDQNSIDWLKEDESREQYYRSTEIDPSKTLDYNISAHSKFTASRLRDIPEEYYLSDNAKVKPKELNRIRQMMEDAMRSMRMDKNENRPKIILCKGNEISHYAGASYNVIENTLKINLDAPEMKDKKYLKLTEIHELYHWEDGQAYIRKYGKITNDNLREYFDYLENKAKKQIEKLEGQGYNLKKVSDYARKSYDGGKPNEVYTEFRAHRKEGLI